MSVRKSLPTARNHALAARTIAVLALLAAGCVNGPLGGPSALALDGGRLPAWTTDQARASDEIDQSIPTPQAVIGHAIGDGAVRYEPMIRYLNALADASPLVTLTPYAESHEGRTLYYLTITSQANHAQLSAIKADNAKLADPRKLSGEKEGDRIIETLPGIAWLAYSIHGDELSSTDAAVQVAFELVAGTDDQTRRLRDELVIHIDPLMNPDGRERYLGQLQHLTGRVTNPDYQAMQHWGLWAAGRGNHYLFDLNRDWLMQVHPETRGRAAIMLEWNPHLVVDSHEMGALDTYLFDPPREPFNVNISEKNLDWRRRFSADQARAFDREGWSYYTREWYEEWYPGYTNAWAGLQGAVGILYEQAGVNAAAVKQATGQLLTYRDAVHHQVVSSFANLESLRTNRRAILHDYLADRQWAVSAARSGTETFLVPPMGDRALADRFIDLLSRQGIESGIAEQPIDAIDVVNLSGQSVDTKTFPAGTLVVPAAQPRRRLLRAILEFDPHMSTEFLEDERKSLENRRGTKIYDITAWNLSMAYGIPGYWAGSVSELSLRNPSVSPLPPYEKSAGYGYLIDGDSSDIHQAVAHLLERDCKVRIAVKPFTIGSHAYHPGTALLRSHENPAGLVELIDESAAGLELRIRAVDTALAQDGPDLGGNRFELLTPPRIAVATQWPIASTSFGATWYLLDHRLGLRVSPIAVQRLGRSDLRKYNVIVLPYAWSPGALRGVLDEPAVAKLKSWVEAGGTLVASGGTVAFLADEDRGLSSVRLRRDVLDKLAIYDEALTREINARNIQVDPDQVWAGNPSTSPERDESDVEPVDAKNTAKKSNHDVEAAKRKDDWQQLFAPTGAFVNAALDTEHWLTFGLTGRKLESDRIPVLLQGRYALMAKHPVQTPVRLVAKSQLRLSGLLWPEARERWENTAYATVERLGYGQVILFAFDPFFRGYTEGAARLFLNAVIFGPGMGTSQPVPW